MPGLLTRPRLLVRNEGGFTLIELLITMSLLLVVFTAITDAFISGTHSEDTASNRVQVQADARLALSKMRDDLHCASTIGSVQQYTGAGGTGYALAFKEGSTNCTTVDTSAANPYVQWCTVPLGTTGRYALYRTLVPSPTNSCAVSSSTFELTDIVQPLTGWPTNAQATALGATNAIGNLWPDSRACTAVGHDFLVTQAVDIGVNPDTTSPHEVYELDDNIALRNSAPCGYKSSGVLQFVQWPFSRVSGSTVTGTDVPINMSGYGAGSTAPTGTVTITAFTGGTAPATCTSGGTTVGSVTISGNGTYTFSGSFPSGGLSTGTDYWYASYGGDTNNAASNTACGAGMPSTTVTGTKQNLTSFALTAPSSATTVSGVSLTANLAPAGPTGTVSFYQATGASAPGAACGGSGWSATSPATATVSGTSAAVTASTPTAATYWFCASYGGDSSFNSSTTSNQSVAVTVPPDTFSFSTIAGQTAGTSFNTVVITAQKPGGAGTDTTYTGTKTVVFTGPGNSPSGQSPTYPATVSFTNGVSGAFSLTLYKAQSAALTATDGSVTGTSGSFTVGAGPTAKFLLTNPGAQTDGTAFTVTVNTQDAWQNQTNDNTTHTIVWTGAANAPDGKAPAYASSTVTFLAGSATTGNFTFYNGASTTLTATEGAKTGSTTFTVNAAAATQMAFVNCSTPGGNSTCSGAPIGLGNNSSMTFAIQTQDAHGNASAPSVAISITVTSSSSSHFSISGSPVSISMAATTSGTVTVTHDSNNSSATLTAHASAGGFADVTLGVTK